MKFVVITYGTEGDTRPMALLCRALMDAGHGAHLLADAVTLGCATALGVPATGLAGDIRRVLRQDTKLAKDGGGFGHTASAFARIARVNSEAWLRAAVAAGEDCDAVVLGGLAGFVGFSAAEALGIPAIGTGLIPITPTRAFASPFLRPATVPRSLNRMSHTLVNTMLWRAFKAPVNAARRAVCGLPARRHLWTDRPMLYGISPSLVPQPADWPPTARVCGQWLAPVMDWTPPPALGEFLAAGEPPIYLGFGSMAALGGARLLREALAALRGRRALFYPGWGSVAGADLPANVHVLADAPHGWLFPRTTLVVHHGGAGTAHAAARAGVPSVVVPFAGDQFFWADRLRHAGAAPPPVPAKGLCADRLARAIDAAGEGAPRAGAAALAASIGREDGLKTAVTAILALTKR
ncbi:MAG: glycosyltransferase family 1 protein [Alphaproteobacteria bacterium]|nr:glycosyltransferase family 1 protein [Alphaproteobacteria bacterium]